jgi:hypothetical protein
MNQTQPLGNQAPKEEAQFPIVKVFLGGDKSNDWRLEFISMLQIGYFNPINKSLIEIKQEKKKCDYHLYVINSLTDCLSIAEAVDSSNKEPNKTLICVPKAYIRKSSDFAEIEKIITNNGSKCFTTLTETAKFLNHGRKR